MIHKITKIKNLPDLQPDHNWLRLNKARLLSEIAEQQQSTEVLSLSQRLELISLKITRRLMPSTFKVVSLSLLLIFVFSTTYVAQAAVPGDVLWPVKISLEKAELALAPDPVSEAEILLKHADHRLQELDILSSRQGGDVQSRDAAISDLVRRLEKNIVAADSSLKLAKSDSSDTNRSAKAAVLAGTLSRKADSTAKVLEKRAKDFAGVVIVDGRVISSNQIIYNNVNVIRGTGISTSTEKQRGQEAKVDTDVVTALTEAIKVHEGVSSSALDAVVAIHDQNSQAVAPDDIKKLVADKLDYQTTKLQQVTDAWAKLDIIQVRKAILTQEKDKTVLTLTEVNALDGQIKKINESLQNAKKLLETNKADEALTTVNEAKGILDQVAETLSKIVVLGSSDTQTGTTTPAKEEPKGSPVKIETISTTTEEAKE
jgi:predicted negative regulator of RcsB-dependent stress response